MVKKLPHMFSISMLCGNNAILYAETPNNPNTDDLLNAFSAMTIIENHPTGNEDDASPSADVGQVMMLERSLPASSPEVSNCGLMDKLVLPWQDKSWNVTITNAKSTIEIWARLIGPEYSVREN